MFARGPRSLVTFLLFPVILAGAFCMAAEPLPSTRPPNIVLFIADDLGWADCPINGGRDARMPNLDRLAARGMTLSHAFVASPSCAPSRAALLTGLDPMRNGSMLNHARPKKALKKFPAYFKELGYDTAAIGKTAHYRQSAEYGFDHASHFNYHQDDCIEFAVDWLARRTSEKPLCLVVGTNWPHVPWPKESSYDPAKLTLPPTLVDTPETRLAYARYLEAVGYADRDLGLVVEAVRKHLGDNTIFLFSGDNGAQLPFGKWNCYDTGLRTALAIAWPGRIKPGAKSNAMVSWIDVLPTLVAAAGGSAPQDIDGKSFLPVLLGRATEHRDKILGTHSGDGVMNRYPMRSVWAKDFLYIRNLDPAAEHHTHIDKGVGPDGRSYWDAWTALAKSDSAAAATIRRYHTRLAEELYDTAADPWQLKNLAADPAHAPRLAQMRLDLEAWMTHTGDKGLETERALPDPSKPAATRPAARR